MRRFSVRWTPSTAFGASAACACGSARSRRISIIRSCGAKSGSPPLEDCRIAEESHEEELEDHSEAARIQKLLHALREPYKEVFMWRVYGEKSFRDIGALFGKTENWACVTYHRAKRMIREGLEDD